jgi:DNA repair protein RadC
MKIYECVLEEKGELNITEEIEGINDAVNVFKTYGLHKKAEECMMLLTMDSDFNTTGLFEVACGNTDEIILDLREIIKRACLMNAANIIIAHNHTVQNANPSDEDIELTEDLDYCCQLLGISLVDHIVLTLTDFKSIKKYIIEENI